MSDGRNSRQSARGAFDPGASASHQQQDSNQARRSRVEQIADRVYELLREDLRLERERHGRQDR